MKKSVLIVALLIMVLLSACGKKEVSPQVTEVTESEVLTEAADSSITTVGLVGEEALWNVIDRDDGTVFITAYHGQDTALKIPSSVGGKTVSGIYQMAFYGNQTLKKVEFPETVASINAQAFFECKALEQIVFSKSVTSIGNHAFSLCESLKSVTLPQHLEYLGEGAFAGCSSLSTVVFECDSLKEIQKQCFKNTAIKELRIPTCVTQLGYYVASAYEIDVYIPESVVEFDDSFSSRETVVIHGKPGSAAEAFAEKNGNTFVPEA